MKIFLTGGWGYGNLGDDAILASMLRSLRSTFNNPEIILSTFNRQETEFHHAETTLVSMHAWMSPHKLIPLKLLCYLLWKLTFKLTGLHCFVGKEFKALAQAMQRSDIAIMGGGGYFNDIWRGQLIARLVEIDLAKTMNKKIMIYGQTVGPFAKDISKKYFGRFLNKFDFIAYRDKQSLKTLNNYGFDLNKATHTADEANLLPALTQGRSVFGKYGIDASKYTLGVMIQKFRPYESVDGTKPFDDIKNQDQYFSEIEKGLRQIIAKANANVVFIPSTSWDIPVCEALYQRLTANGEKGIFLIKDEPVNDFIAICQSVDCMLSTNMHPVILASTNGVPSLAISYFYKVDDFMSSVGLEDYVIRIDQATAERLTNTFDKLVANFDQAKAKLAANFETVKARARKNAEAAKNMAK